MATNVKFYSVSSLPSTPESGGIYFVDGGELYKGASRFGANKVFSAVPEASTLADATAGITGQIGGDILVGFGAAKVWDAEFDNGAEAAKGSWRDMGADNAALQSSWQADISAWTSGLAIGDSNSYITSISQDEDGKVTAAAAAFPTLNLSASTVSGSANGIVVSVTTESAAVTSVTLSASELNVTSISANTGTFSNLTVTDVASFVATTVSADTLTINGSTVEQIADSRIAAIAESTQTSSAGGITVGVTTSSGGVTGVTLGVTIGTTVSTSTGAGLVTEGAVKNYVDDALESLDNAMHFRGVETSLPTTDVAPGDIVVIGGSDTLGYITPQGAAADTAGEGNVNTQLVSGQEYIYTQTGADPSTGKWELIGDQSTYATKAYVDAQLNVKASVGTSTSSSAGLGVTISLTSDSTPTVTLDTTNIVSASDSVTTGNANLVTAGAVADFVAGAVTGGTSSSTLNGVGVEVVTAGTTAVPSVTLSGVGTAASMNYADTLESTGTSLPTESAVANYVSTVISGLDANVSSSENASIVVGVSQVDGKVTAVTAELVWLDASGAAITA